MASSSAALVVVLAIVSLSLFLEMGSAAAIACNDCPTSCTSSCTSNVNSAPWDPCSGACGGPSPDCVQSCKTKSFNECKPLCRRYYGGSVWTADSYCSNACRPGYIDYNTPCNKQCCSSPQQCQDRKSSAIQQCTYYCTADCKTRCVNA